MDASREIKDEKSSTFETIEILYIPPKVSFSDLNKGNKKLFADDEIKAIEEKLKEEKDGRYSKKDLHANYGVIKLDGELFAVYKGLKQEKHLGKGGMGKVKLVQNLTTGGWHALKIREELEDKKTEEVHQSLFVAEHQHLKNMGKAKKTMISRKKENKPAKHQIILEYERGKDLINFLNDQDSRVINLPSIRWIDMTLQMLQAVKELHERGFLHRDIKLDNFMYDVVNNRIKLIDFGLMVEKDEQKSVTSSTLVGTMAHNAPELKRAQEKVIYRDSTDVFALGCSIRELLGFYIENVPGNFLNKTTFSRDQSIREFLEKMINDKPQRRPTLDDAIQFFNGVRQNLMPLSYSTVGILNLSEYRNAVDKKQFLQALKFVDSVILIDDKMESKEDNSLLRAEVSRSLNENGIVVQDRMVVAPNINNNIANLPDYLAKEEKKEEREVVNYLYFSSALDYKNDADLNAKGIQRIAVTHSEDKRYIDEIRLSTPVNEENATFALNELQKELDRINKKYNLHKHEDKKLDGDDVISIAKRRANAIVDTQSKLKAKIISEPMRFTYHFLYKELDSLQKKMLTTKQYSRYFGAMFESKDPKGGKAVGKIKEDIQNRRRLS